MTRKGYILYVLVFGLILVLIGLTTVIASGGSNYLILFYANIILLIVFLTAIYEVSKLKE